MEVSLLCVPCDTPGSSVLIYSDFHWFSLEVVYIPRYLKTWSTTDEASVPNVNERYAENSRPRSAPELDLHVTWLERCAALRSRVTCGVLTTGYSFLEFYVLKAASMRQEVILRIQIATSFSKRTSECSFSWRDVRGGVGYPYTLVHKTDTLAYMPLLDGLRKQMMDSTIRP